MIINKDGIDEKDSDLGVKILNQLRMGNRVFGNPAEGLKITLKELERDLDANKNVDPLKWEVSNKDIVGDIRRIKAGIKGEETFAECFKIRQIRIQPNN